MAGATDDFSTVVTLVSLVREWGGLSVLVAGFTASVAFIWRTSAKTTKALSHIENHSDRLDKMEARVEVAEKAQQTAEVKLAATPTHADIAALRSELATMSSSIQSQMQAGFSQLVHLFSARTH